MDVRMPDGTIVRNVPDGITQDDLLSRYQASKAEPTSIPQAIAIGAGRIFDRAAAGLREAVAGGLNYISPGDQTLSGLVTGAQPRGLGDRVVGAIDSANNALGMGNVPQSNDVTADKAYANVERQHPIATTVGEIASQAALPLAAQTFVAGIQPGSATERLTRAGLTYGIGKAGQALGGMAGDYLANRAANPAPLTAAEQTLKDATDAGYKIAPNEAGQQSVLQWLGGQIKTQQTMASKNVSNTTRLAAEEIGLPPGPITRDALDTVRSQAGQAYDAVKNAQFVIPSDSAMQSTAQGIADNYQRLTKSFQSLKSPEIETLIADLKNQAFDSEGLVEAVKRFRSDGFANLASAEPAKKALGRVQLQAQDALEGLIDRTLTAAGQPEAVSALQAARQLIAKTYSVQNALDANGNVIASKLANQMAKGKPLSGNLETIAQTAAAFPKSTQNFGATPPAFSKLDVAAAALAHGPKGAAWIGAAPIARALASSNAYQNLMVAPNNAVAGLLGNAAPALPILGSRLGLLGQQLFPQGSPN